MTQVLAADGAWCWFQDPRAVFVADRHRRTYATWITRGGTLQVGGWDHDTRQVSAHDVKAGWGRDDHGSGSLLVLPDRRLMLFYSQHNGTGLHCRTTTRSEDIGEWDEEVTVSTATRITYPNPVYLRDEALMYVFWRGPDWKPAFATSRDGKAWSAPRMLLRDENSKDDSVRPYVKIASDGRSSIHFAFTDGHPRDEPHNSIHYVRYERGTFHAADGTKLGAMDELPLAPRKRCQVYDGQRLGMRAWIWDVAQDRRGFPVIAYTRLPEADDHRYHYARWDGSAWTDTEITPGGSWFPQTPTLRREREPHYSGGMALDHADPSVVYVSRPVAGHFEIERWVTGDGGGTWSTTPITVASSQGNVRPVVPRGFDGNGSHVIWMRGRYVHYTNFSTEIAMHIP